MHKSIITLNRCKLLAGTVALCCIKTPAIAADYAKTEKAGDILQVMIPAVAYASTFYVDDKEGRKQFYKSFVANEVVTYSLKYAINKQRPNGGDHSFPSGHTSAAFQGAGFIHERYGLKYAIPAYIGASYVGYSRVAANKHDVQDVLAGAALGVLSSRYFTTEYKNVTVVPQISSSYQGMQIHVSF